MLGVALAACGGGGGAAGDGDCVIDGSTSGAVTWSSASAPACLIPFGGDVGIWMVYRPLDEAVFSFEVTVDTIHAGETGTFAADVAVYSDATTMYDSPTCSVTVSEHTLVAMHAPPDADEYLIVGDGTCPDPASGTGGSVTIAPFAFRFPARW